MASTSKIKLLLTLLSVLVFGWAMSPTLSTAFGVSTDADMAQSTPMPTPGPGYVGSEACQVCHEDQFKVFAGTKHGKLGSLPDWKNKVIGCEGCHGPGAKHMEDATVPGTMISFKNMNAKAVSQTCLGCHAGKESHNNYQRGEHWRNDVGCTDCHSPHGTPLHNMQTGSQTYIAETSLQNASVATVKLLKTSEPQLCLSCHTETKSQFAKPFHHKVLEGTMKCSDCHNPHGGFEAKQTKLSVGADTGCIKCHADKHGPFAFEHAPLKTEGCSACHSPHGSSNPKMLNRSSVRQLCIECHSAITESNVPGVPSFHNQATVRYTNCTVCHTAIHGSNASNRFLR